MMKTILILTLFFSLTACGSPEKPLFGGNEAEKKSLPSGDVIAFSGEEIPPGWTLCDGRSAPTGRVTPDLRGRFIRGSEASADLGATGGSEGHGHAGNTGQAQGSTVGLDRDNDAYPPTARHTHNVNLEEAQHLPPFTSLLYIMKD